MTDDPALPDDEHRRTVAEIRELLVICRARAADPRFTELEQMSYDAYVVALEWVLGETEDHMRAHYRRGRAGRRRRR